MNVIKLAAKERSQDRAYAFIKRRILSLDFKPGERLRAEALATHLKISRTPVREALSRLEQEGLVLRESGWGYVVRTMSHADVVELYKVREILEVEAAREAANLADAATIKAMDAELQKAKRALARNRLEDFQASVRAFQALIGEASGNDLLRRMMASIDDKIRLVGALSIRRRKERAEEALDENIRIFTALKKHDAEQAEQAVREHIRRAAEVAGMRRVEFAA